MRSWSGPLTRFTLVSILDPNLDVFAGHYPDFPVLPGILQCEAAFQAERF